jgi:endonuclease YncB( thermonuclease family)
MTPAASEKQPAPAERVGHSEIATSAEPPASDADAAISERMGPQSPASPKPPLVASVPTPTARPTQNIIGDTEVTTSAKPRASDGKTGQPDEAGQYKAGQDKARQDEARQDERPPASPDTKAPPTETAALTPQPEKPADEPAAIGQPNGALKPIDLSRPLAERAGILTVGGRSVQLAGIVPTDPERSCTGPNGKEWPCGTLARTALRSFLLGRTITCDVPDPAWKGAVTADCRFAKLSIGDWLARNGWAEPTSGSQFSAAADEARKAGRGVYGNDPRKKHESTLAPEPPKDDPLNPI